MIYFDCELNLSWFFSVRSSGLYILANLMIKDSSSITLNFFLSWTPRPHQIHIMHNHLFYFGQLLEQHVVHTLEILHY